MHCFHIHGGVRQCLKKREKDNEKGVEVRLACWVAGVTDWQKHQFKKLICVGGRLAMFKEG